MNTYTIKKAYPFIDKNHSQEITIQSDDLFYSELENLSGMQCRSKKDYDKIKKLCQLISKSIKEIDKLNSLLPF